MDVIPRCPHAEGFGSEVIEPGLVPCYVTIFLQVQGGCHLFEHRHRRPCWEVQEVEGAINAGV
jgi:hypothetical protein